MMLVHYQEVIVEVDALLKVLELRKDLQAWYGETFGFEVKSNLIPDSGFFFPVIIQRRDFRDFRMPRNDEDIDD